MSSQCHNACRDSLYSRTVDGLSAAVRKVMVRRARLRSLCVRRPTTRSVVRRAAATPVRAPGGGLRPHLAGPMGMRLYVGPSPGYPLDESKPFRYLRLRRTPLRKEEGPRCREGLFRFGQALLLLVVMKRRDGMSAGFHSEATYANMGMSPAATMCALARLTT